VTCYHLGSLAFTQVQRASTLATAPWQPALTAMHAQGDRAALKHAYLRGGRTALWGLLLPTIPLIIFRNEVIKCTWARSFSSRRRLWRFC